MVAPSVPTMPIAYELFDEAHEDSKNTKVIRDLRTIVGFVRFVLWHVAVACGSL
jgi:hypothetical protein